MSRTTLRASNARATDSTSIIETTSRSAGGASGNGSGRSSSSTALKPSAKATTKATPAPKVLPSKRVAEVPSKKPVAKTPTKPAKAVATVEVLSRPAKPRVQVTPSRVAGNLVAGRPLAASLRPISTKLGVKPASPAKKLKSNEPLPYSQRPIDELWREYAVMPSKELRNFFIEKHLELVRFTAERMHMKLPSEVEIDDLMSAGLFGLMDAIDAFDIERGVKFETYCTQRIRGAIFDELRAMDWVPRLVRSRTAKVEKVRKLLEMESGRKATDTEIADRMRVTKPEFEKLQKDSRPVGVVSLNRKWFETDSSKDVREIDVIRDTRQENPVQQIQRQDLQTLITKGLSRAERLIVVLYYYEEMTMKEIGTTLDLSESRVSQMHSSILARLKAQMQHREKDMTTNG